MNPALWVNGRIACAEPGILLFDKDGTLICIHHYWASMIRLRAGRIADLWFAPQARDEVAATLVDCMGVDASGRMKADGPVGVRPRPVIAQIVAAKVTELGHPVTAEEVEREIFKPVDDATEQDLAPLLRPLPNVPGLLRQARASGLRLAIVTTDVTRRAEAALRELGLRDLFDWVVGADQVASTKPAPDLVHKVLAEAGLPPERAVVVGDHPVDVRMGSAAGCAVNIAVLTGLSDAAAFDGLDCVVAPSLEGIEIR